MYFPWLLSLSVGFLSLSQEILWVRLGSFTYGGLPQIFSFVLACYLIGIAVGAHFGKQLCAKSSNLHLAGGTTLLLAGMFDMLIPVLAPLILQKHLSSLLLVALALISTAAIKSVLFPIAHHLGTLNAGSKVGSSVSWVYFGNVLGSTLGPIVTGFYLLDHFTTESCFMIIGVCSLGLAIIMVAKSGHTSATIAVIAASVFECLILTPWHAPSAIESIASGQTDTNHVVHLIQNKHGILHTVSTPNGGDVTYGGNIYDGRISVDMSVNSNKLDRAYVLAASHPSPRKVLVIGMSTGAWTRVALGFPDVADVDVVEINPGYIDLIKSYPAVSPLLADPRVHIHIDDARRWLKRHPDKKYDLIIQNTTYHWRANVANVLSYQYFKEVQQHMLPGAIMAINTTSSMDVVHTVNTAFPFAFSYLNFVYGSDHDIRVSPETASSRLQKCRIGDAPAFLPSHFEANGIAYNVAHNGPVPAKMLLDKPSDTAPGIITDHNVLTEYRNGLFYQVE